MKELPNGCPACGALPCDWADDPYVERQSAEGAADIVAQLYKSAADFDLPPSIQSMQNIRAIDGMLQAAIEIETLRAQLTAATRRAEQAERMLAERDAALQLTRESLCKVEGMLAEVVKSLESISASGIGLWSIREEFGHDMNAYHYQAMKYWFHASLRRQGLAIATLTPSIRAQALEEAANGKA